MKSINKVYMLSPVLCLLLGACAPDRAVVSDAERLNIFCATKKNDQKDERCQSDEVRMDYRDVSLILVQKLTREVQHQMNFMKINTPEKALPRLASDAPENNTKTNQIKNKHVISWKSKLVHAKNETSGLEEPLFFEARSMTKDLGAVEVNTQEVDAAAVLQGLVSAFDQMLSLPQAEGKLAASQHGSFALMQEKNNYLVTSFNPEQHQVDVAWAGVGQAVFSKIDKKGKQFFSNDEIAESGHFKTALSPDGLQQNVEHMKLEWNLSARKDAVLNYSIESFVNILKVDDKETMVFPTIVEVEGGCFRLVGEFRMSNTDGGIKKKPLKSFTSKIVVSATEVKIYNGNADGSFKAEPAKTETIPACSEYNGTGVDYGSVL